MRLFFIIGLAYGANALTFAAVSKSFSVKESCLVSGIANTGGFLSAVLLPSFFGTLLDHAQGVSTNSVEGYYMGFIIPVVFSIIGLAGVLHIKDSRLDKLS